MIDNDHEDAADLVYNILWKSPSLMVKNRKYINMIRCNTFECMKCDDISCIFSHFPVSS